MKKLVILIAAGFALAVSLSMPAMSLAAKFGLVHWRDALGYFLNLGAHLALAGAIVSVIAFVAAMIPPRIYAIVPLVTALISGVCVWAPKEFRRVASSVPPIHNITTDVNNPPLFVAAYEERGEGANSIEPASPEVIAQQVEAYPDLAPIRVTASPIAAFGAAMETAEQLGWEIYASDPDGMRIEAVETTFWLGFKDDVVIRITPDDAGGAIVDLRSVSRVGGSDVGANAARIRKFTAAFTKKLS